MNTLSERIQWLLETFDISQTELAKLANVKQPSVANWLNGRTKTLTSAVALNICSKLPVLMPWLVYGQGDALAAGASVSAVDTTENYDSADEDDPLVYIQVSGISCSAGPGFIPDFYEDETRESRAYRLSWLQKHHYNPEKLKVFTVTGESMEPLLWDGDSITVDTTQREIRNDRVFAFTYEGEFRVKRLRKQLDGGVLVISENPSWQPEKIAAQDTERLFIIGRVIDKSGSGGL